MMTQILLSVMIMFLLPRHFYGEDMNNLNEYCEKNEGSCSSTNGGPVVSASRDTGGDSDFDPELVKKQVNLTQRVAKEVFCLISSPNSSTFFLR